jgi:4-hydroxybenzoate polyprenyltransferase
LLRWPVTLAYPYAKRFVSMPQAVLGVAFSMGMPMAFAAVQGEVSALWRWVLMLGNLFWVLAYDTEYAMVDRDDDLKIGMKTSAITLGRWDVPAIMLCYLFFIAIWAVALMPYALVCYFYVAIAAGAGAGGVALRADPHTQPRGLFQGVPLNHWLGFTVFAGIGQLCPEIAGLLDKAPKTRRPGSWRAARRRAWRR